MPKVETMFRPFRAARIRKIIISNGPDRPRLKMSSPRRLVGQTLSSIISGPPRNDVLWDSSSIRRVPNEPRPHLSGCQNLSVELERSKLSSRDILRGVCAPTVTLVSFLRSLLSPFSLYRHTFASNWIALVKFLTFVFNRLLHSLQIIFEEKNDKRRNSIELNVIHDLWYKTLSNRCRK